MNNEAHVKDWYVARVVVLENENKVLHNEVAELRVRLCRRFWSPPVFFALGWFLCVFMWRAFK